MKKATYIIALIVILTGIITGGSYALKAYTDGAPTRVATNFVKDIAQTDKLSAAYKLTSPDYQAVVKYSTFVSDMKGLSGSKPSFSNLRQTVDINQATVTGTVDHLPVKEYSLFIQMSESSSDNWQITAIIIH